MDNLLVDLLAALAIAVGLAGIIAPVLPGSLLILAALLVWAIAVGESTAWVVVGIAVAVLVLGQVVKYVVPGRRMKASGVPNATLLVGAVLGIVGFFVIPVVGLPLGFVLGVYAAEHRRVGAQLARGTTVAALRAVGLSILIELAAGLVAAVLFLTGAVLT